MNSYYKDLLNKLILSCNVSGHSEEVATIFKSHAEALGLVVGVDMTGSVSALLNGKMCPINSGYKRKILIISNQDSPGFIVKEKQGDNKYKVCKIGKLNIRIKGPIDGFLSAAKKKIPVKLLRGDEGIFIEIEESGINPANIIGIPIVFNPKLDTSIRGKYKAPSIGTKSNLLSLCMVMDKTLKNTVYDNVYFVAAALNSLNSLGSRICSDKIDPTIAIDIDTRKCSKKSLLGKGPIILNSPLVNKQLFNLIIETAKKNKIPHRVEVLSTEKSLNVERMLYAAGGISCCSIMLSVYSEYGIGESVSKNDIENSAKLISKVIPEINKIESFIPEV